MAGKIHLEIVTPSRKVLTEECDEVYLPGPKGEFGVLPEHAALVSTITVGPVRFRSGGSTKSVAVRGGFVQVLKNRVSLLADQCVQSTEVNKTQLTQEKDLIDKKMIDPQVGIQEREGLILDRAWTEAKQNLL